MKYIWPFICTFFWTHGAICYAETQAGEIKDAEFVIEKQKKNKISQEQRLFFKAPTRPPKKSYKPLVAIGDLTLENLPFDPAPEIHFPLPSEKKELILPFNHYCRLGIASLLLPYGDLSLHNLSLLKGIWSTQIAYIPELWDTKSRKGLFDLKGKYGIGLGLLGIDFNYQHDWYKPTEPTPTRILHRINGSMLISQANASSTHDGSINCHSLTYHNEKIGEQLFTLKYKWLKRWDHLSLKIDTYNDIAYYASQTIEKKYLTIVSATPTLYVPFLKTMQLKVGLRMAYHNDPIIGIIPNFDLYPMVKISYAAAKWLTPYIGIGGMGLGGSVERLCLHKAVETNPFISKDYKLSHHHQYLKVYGGIKGSFASDLSYHLNATYRQLKNLPRMVVADAHSTTYKLLYNEKTHNVVKTTGIVDYIIPSTKLSTSIKGTYYLYQTNTSVPIWWYNKPNYRFKPTISYRPHPKLSLTGSLNLHGSTIVKYENGSPKKLDKIINIALGGNYFCSKRFAIFVMIDNLLNRKHTSYTDYPDKKFNITGGIQYKW